MNYDSILNQKIQNIKPSGIRKFFDILEEMTDAISLGIGHLLQDVNKLPNAGGLYVLNFFVEDIVVIHTKMYSLSSGSWGRNTRCFSLYFFRIKWVAVPVTP